MSLQKIEETLRRPNVGLLILRVGIGAAFTIHGATKFLGGKATLTAVGSAMGQFGIDFAPAMWGFFAALAETVGGLLLIAGFLTRPAALFLAFTMFVATAHKLPGDITLHSFKDFAYPLMMLVASLALLFCGPGRYSVAKEGN